MSQHFIHFGPISISSGSSPISKQMARYCRYMCRAIASKNEMGTLHITFTSMLNRRDPNQLVKLSRNSIHFRCLPPPIRRLRLDGQTKPAARLLYCAPINDRLAVCAAQGVIAVLQDSATTEPSTSVVLSLNAKGALRDNGETGSSSTGCSPQ